MKNLLKYLLTNHIRDSIVITGIYNMLVYIIGLSPEISLVTIMVAGAIQIEMDDEKGGD